MTKKLSFKPGNEIRYEVGFSQTPFIDNGSNKIKFAISDILSVSMIRRLDGDDWIILEGDILPEHLPYLGREIRRNFDT
ncbi:hypothetical protein [Pedobacter sp. Leaf216]|uniref:hypothetical protein n=1 Tax=Pedobacter sp. Leaf216 TaxID=1735684 RepID=UPI000ADDEBAC|nr:hypothetical protein [Pedobacter sp. Leaf216]